MEPSQLQGGIQVSEEIKILQSLRKNVLVRIGCYACTHGRLGGRCIGSSEGWAGCWRGLVGGNIGG